MSERRAVTKTIATRYVRSDSAGKKVILDELCASADGRPVLDVNGKKTSKGPARGEGH